MSDIYGTEGEDSIATGSSADVIYAGGGNDYILFGETQGSSSEQIDGGEGFDTVEVELHVPNYNGRVADWAFEQVDPVLFGGYDTRIQLVERTVSSGQNHTHSQGVLRNVEAIQGPDGTLMNINWPDLDLLAKTAPILEASTNTVRADPSYNLITLADRSVVQVLHERDSNSDTDQTFTLRALNDDGQVTWETGPIGRGEGTTADYAEHFSTNSNTARLTALADGGFAMVWLELVDVADRNVDQYGNVYLQVYNADGSARAAPNIILKSEYIASEHLSLEQLSDGRLAVLGNARYDMATWYVGLDGVVTDSEVSDLNKGSTDNHRLVALEGSQYLIYEDDERLPWSDIDTSFIMLDKLDGNGQVETSTRLHKFAEGTTLSYSSAARLDADTLVMAVVTTDRDVYLVQYDADTDTSTTRMLDLPYDGRHGNNLISLIEDPDGGAWLSMEFYAGNDPAGAAHTAHAFTVFLDEDGQEGDWFDATDYDGASGNHYRPAVAPTASGILVTWEESGYEIGRIAYNLADSFTPEVGSAGADTLPGTAGDDSVTAGAGDDLVIQSGGTDRYDGGAGFDTFRMGDDGGFASLMQGYTDATDRSPTRSGLAHFEAIEGGAGDDLIEGDGGRNSLAGGSGDDTITGFGGADVLIGGAGADVMAGGAGDDVYFADATDMITEAEDGGTDLVITGQSHTLSANVDNLTLTGAGDIDGTGNALGNGITGNSGANVLNGGEGDNTLLGEGGDDVITAGSGDDFIGGGAGNDSITVDDGANTIYGGLGNDTVNGGAGEDRIIGGGNGANILLGNNGEDTVTGGSGDDFLAGGEGNDVIAGIGGANRIYTGLGDDTVHGGTGNDNILGAGDGTNQLFGNGGDDTIRAGAGGDFMGGGAGNDTVLGAGGNDTVYGGAGDDFVGGGAGNDLLYGSAGSNRIYTGLGSDSVQGGTGDDNIIGAGDASSINLLSGNDGNDIIRAGAGGDILVGGAGDDRLFGGNGDNTVYLGTGDDFVGGGAGDDMITAGAGANRIYGGVGDDTVNAGAGTDVITGGAGADVFVFNSAADAGIGAERDLITDFEVGVDKIDLSAMNLSLVGAGPFTGGSAQTAYLGNGTNGYLVGDVNGDGTNDFAIELSGAPALTADDLIL